MIRKSEADKVPLNTSFSEDGEYICKAGTFFCSKGYDMLNIDISHDGEVVARYFADKVSEEYKGYLIGKPWRKIKLKNLIQLAAGEEPGLKYDSWTTSWLIKKADWQWADHESDDKVHMFCFGDIDWWENKIESRRYLSRQERRHEQINNEIRELIAPNPEGLLKWIYSIIGGGLAVESKEILGNYVYQCTECGGKWLKKKSRYRTNREIMCPHCGKPLRVARDAMTEWKNFYIFSKCNDGTERWYERFIRGRREWDKVTGEWILDLIDETLAVIDKGKRLGKLYYRVGNEYEEKKPYWLGQSMRKGYICPDFGGAEEFMNSQQAHCLRYLADKQICVNANKLIVSDKKPALEYLLKGRFERMALDIIEKYYWQEGKEETATSLQDYLRLDKQRCNRLRQINGSFFERDWLRYEQVTGRKVSEEDLRFFSRHGLSVNDTYYGVREMLRIIPSPTKLRHYIAKQAEILELSPSGTVREYNDYIRMAKQQGLNMSSDIFARPKNLREAHDECVRVEHEKEYEQKAADVAMKFPRVPEILAGIREKYAFEGDEYIITVPEGIADIIAEGRALGHCIDTTDRYFERIQDNVTYLVFLRKKAAPKMSWYTLEIEPGGTVRQQRTTGNRQNKEDVKAYMPFIREWQQVVRSRISDEDREAAERSREIRLEEYKELREKKETVRNGLLAGKLLVDVLEADLVEAM